MRWLSLEVRSWPFGSSFRRSAKERSGSDATRPTGKAAYCSGVSTLAIDLRIFDWNIDDLLEMRMLNLARVRRCGRSQECFEQLAPGQNRMPVLALAFGNDGPFRVQLSLVESVAQQLNRRWFRRRPIHQRDHSRVAASIQHLLQPGLQRAELSALGIGIYHHRCAASINDRGHIALVFANHHQHHVHERIKQRNRRRKKRARPQRIPRAQAATATAPCRVPCAKTHLLPESRRTTQTFVP